MKKIIISMLFISGMVSGCSTVRSIGVIGPKKLNVYTISQNDFLSASRMIVVLDEKGNVAATTGGTVSGFGTVAAQTAGTLSTAGGLIYGAKNISDGLRNMHLNTKVDGIPSKFDVNTNSKIDINTNSKIDFGLVK